jgi:exopolyphosphatase/guanosine-5'-triphosphate,3'-diphosphate pyrophosphatase
MTSHAASESYAAVDLGSNSFHMIVANYADGRLQVIDRLKDMVRLASGLDTRRNLSAESMERAIQCLERFGQRIGEIPRVNVRAVGTNALRQARNGRSFLADARKALGHPIEIIAGREEARLIFLGVAHTIHHPTERRLIVDIGGGSTELIIGTGFHAAHLESLYMGCVSTSERFFPDGEISAKRMRRALLFARQELEGVEATYRKVGWDAAIGASGTIIAISDSIAEWGLGKGAVTPEGLEKLRDRLVAAGNVSTLALNSVSERRRPVFPGGVAILSAVFEALKIERMTISDGALREGLLYDLIGRAHDRDVRNKTMSDLVERYGADAEQGRRVRTTAMDLFRQARKSWNLDSRTDGTLLKWAAEVHEIGLSIAHAQYHRHAAYVLANSDLPGFSREEQFNLAMLVRLHRRRVALEELLQLSDPDRQRIFRLCILLRLAVLLNRSRTLAALPEITATAEEALLELTFPQGWLDAHPLTQTDLESEREFLAAAKFELRFA